jgi:hypothetical protein
LILFIDIRLNPRLNLCEPNKRVVFLSTNPPIFPSATAKSSRQYSARPLRWFRCLEYLMKTFSVRRASEVPTSDWDDLERLYSEVQRLRKLLGVLKCGSAAGPIVGCNERRMVH